MAFRDLLHTLSHSSSAQVPEPEPQGCIVQHLNWLFNTGRHHVPHLPEYGLPEFIDYLAETNAELRLANDLRRAIEKYEPRLSQVRVSPDSESKGDFTNHLRACFIIEAVIVQSRDRTAFLERAEVRREGVVSVR